MPDDKVHVRVKQLSDVRVLQSRKKPVLMKFLKLWFRAGLRPRRPRGDGDGCKHWIVVSSNSDFLIPMTHERFEMLSYPGFFDTCLPALFASNQVQSVTTSVGTPSPDN